MQCKKTRLYGQPHIISSALKCSLKQLTEKRKKKKKTKLNSSIDHIISQYSLCQLCVVGGKPSLF